MSNKIIACDSSSLISFFNGDAGKDCDLVLAGLQSETLCIPAIVLTEVISDPKPKKGMKEFLLKLPVLDNKDDFWIRAGELRAKVLEKKLKARLGDALIAQTCVDHDVLLITRDTDFKNFAKHCGLKLAC